MRLVAFLLALLTPAVAWAQLTAPQFQCSGTTVGATRINFNGGCSFSPPTLTVTPGGGGGGVSSVSCGNSLTCSPNPISSTGTISLPNTIGSSSGNSFTINSAQTNTSMAAFNFTTPTDYTGGGAGYMVLWNGGASPAPFFAFSVGNDEPVLVGLNPQSIGTITSSFKMAPDALTFADHTSASGPLLRPQADASGKIGDSASRWLSGYFSGRVTASQFVPKEPAPTVTNCGAGASVVGTNSSGIITVGSTVGQTICDLVFSGIQWNVGCTPSCVCSPDSTSYSMATTAASGTGATFESSASMTGHKVYYSCQCSTN